MCRRLKICVYVLMPVKRAQHVCRMRIRMRIGGACVVLSGGLLAEIIRCVRAGFVCLIVRAFCARLVERQIFMFCKI